MSRPLAVLRPQPGNAATVARIAALGLVAIPLPLFVVHALDWTVPELAEVDALLVTSANAIRHGGEGLAALKALPVVAVGAATALAARQAGFFVSATGEAGVGDAIARAGPLRLLHLAGRDRASDTGLPTLTVYASDSIDVDASVLIDSIALVHSPRAAQRLAEIVPDRRRIAITAISGAVAVAAGGGWRGVTVAESPTDAALIAAARTLAD